MLSGLTCQELVELVTDYLEGALDADLLAAFDEHLVGCEGCGRYVDQVRTTVTMLRSLTSPSPLDEAALLAALRLGDRPPSPERNEPPPPSGDPA